MKKIWSLIKPYIRWVILGGTLFFIAKAFKEHWRDVAGIRIDPQGWTMLAIALLVTLLAHIWSGWVWTWILQAFKQPIGQRLALQVYLKTNVAKYLPGNVWHFYGRISAVMQAGGSVGAASISVLLEPLLMAASALAIALISGGLGWVNIASDSRILGLKFVGLAVVLLGVHPRVLNPIVQRLSRSKKVTDTEEFAIEHYPLLPLLGEMGFLGFRGTGFLFTLLAVGSITPSQIPSLLSAFSFAWLLGLVVPGAPGGLGVFEATAIALLDQQLPTGLILTGVALFRLVSILAEISAAGLAILSERMEKTSKR